MVMRGIVILCVQRSPWELVPEDFWRWLLRQALHPPGVIATWAVLFMLR